MNSGIERKIKGLMKQANDPSITEAEAAAFAEKAAELCLKYNVDQNRIILTDPTAPPPKIVQDDLTDMRASYPKHWIYLYNSVETLFGVTVFCSTKRFEYCNRTYYKLFGLEASVEMAKITFAYLHEAIEAMTKQRQREKIIVGVGVANSYRKGAALRIRQKVHEITTRVLNSAGADGMALMRITDQLMNVKREEIGLKAGKMVRINSSNKDAHELGYLDGGRIDVNGAKTSKMLSEAE